jgi:hypothetical protein
VNLASSDGPNGLALDSQGNLWVSTIGGTADNLLKYHATDLMSTGNPAPAVVVSLNKDSFAWPQIVFDPPIVNP